MGPLSLLVINLLKITVPSISNSSHEIEQDNASKALWNDAARVTASDA